jgi:hypothetical protein
VNFLPSIFVNTIEIYFVAIPFKEAKLTRRMNSTPEFQDIVFKAQEALESENFELAAVHYSKLIEHLPPFNLGDLTVDLSAAQKEALLYWSRCSCYVELQNFSKACSDAMHIMKLPDITLEHELLPNVVSTHAAAAFRLARQSLIKKCLQVCKNHLAILASLKRLD